MQSKKKKSFPQATLVRILYFYKCSCSLKETNNCLLAQLNWR